MDRTSESVAKEIKKLEISLSQVSGLSNHADRISEQIRQLQELHTQLLASEARTRETAEQQSKEPLYGRGWPGPDGGGGAASGGGGAPSGGGPAASGGGFGSGFEAPSGPVGPFGPSGGGSLIPDPPSDDVLPVSQPFGFATPTREPGIVPASEAREEYLRESAQRARVAAAQSPPRPTGQMGSEAAVAAAARLQARASSEAIGAGAGAAAQTFTTRAHERRAAAPITFFSWSRWFGSRDKADAVKLIDKVVEGAEVAVRDELGKGGVSNNQRGRTRTRTTGRLVQGRVEIPTGSDTYKQVLSEVKKKITDSLDNIDGKNLNEILYRLVMVRSGDFMTDGVTLHDPTGSTVYSACFPLSMEIQSLVRGRLSAAKASPVFNELAELQARATETAQAALTQLKSDEESGLLDKAQLSVSHTGGQRDANTASLLFSQLEFTTAKAAMLEQYDAKQIQKLSRSVARAIISGDSTLLLDALSKMEITISKMDVPKTRDNKQYQAYMAAHAQCVELLAKGLSVLHLQNSFDKIPSEDQAEILAYLELMKGSGVEYAVNLAAVIGNSWLRELSSSLERVLRGITEHGNELERVGVNAATEGGALFGSVGAAVQSGLLPNWGRPVTPQRLQTKQSLAAAQRAEQSAGNFVSGGFGPSGGGFGPGSLGYEPILTDAQRASKKEERKASNSRNNGEALETQLRNQLLAAKRQAQNPPNNKQHGGYSKKHRSTHKQKNNKRKTRKQKRKTRRI